MGRPLPLPARSVVKTRRKEEGDSKETTDWKAEYVFGFDAELNCAWRVPMAASSTDEAWREYSKEMFAPTGAGPLDAAYARCSMINGCCNLLSPTLSRIP